MTEFRYPIHEGVDVDATLAKARKLFSRGATRGLEGGFTVTIESATQTNEFGYTETIQQFVVTGTPYKYNGWSFVAAVEWLPDGSPLTKVLPGYTGDVINREWLRKGACDHCKATRFRKNQYVVENDNGEMLLVGSTCVRDFLGWDFKVTFFADLKEQFDDWCGGNGQTIKSADIIEYLAVTTAVYEQMGWLSRGKAREQGGWATADKAWAYIFDNDERAYDLRKQVGYISEAHFQKAHTLLTFARAITDTSEYSLNLVAAASQTTVSKSTAGLVASIVVAYDNAQRKNATDASKQTLLASGVRAPSGKCEVVGEIVSIKNHETDFGSCWKMTVKTDEGWMVWVTLPSSITDAQHGDRVTFTAQITPADNDPLFAFGKRPSKAHIIKETVNG